MARNYEVPDVTCDHCKRAIEDEVKQLDGVTEVVVDVDKKLVTVDGLANDEAVIGAINEAGYDVAGVRSATGADEPSGEPDYSGPLP